jgi:hypothetical protein
LVNLSGGKSVSFGLDNDSYLSLINNLIDLSISSQNSNMIIQNLLPEEIHYIRLDPEITSCSVDERNNKIIENIRNQFHIFLQRNEYKLSYLIKEIMNLIDFN